MSTFKNKNSLRTIEAQIVQKLNEVRPKLTGSYKKKRLGPRTFVSNSVLTRSVGA